MFWSDERCYVGFRPALSRSRSSFSLKVRPARRSAARFARAAMSRSSTSWMISSASPHASTSAHGAPRRTPHRSARAIVATRAKLATERSCGSLPPGCAGRRRPQLGSELTSSRSSSSCGLVSARSSSPRGRGHRRREVYADGLRRSTGRSACRPEDSGRDHAHERGGRRRACRPQPVPRPTTRHEGRSDEAPPTLEELGRIGAACAGGSTAAASTCPSRTSPGGSRSPRPRSGRSSYCRAAPGSCSRASRAGGSRSRRCRATGARCSPAPGSSSISAGDETLGGASPPRRPRVAAQGDRRADGMGARLRCAPYGDSSSPSERIAANVVEPGGKHVGLEDRTCGRLFVATRESRILMRRESGYVRVSFR